MGTVEDRIAIAEDAAIGGDEPVPPPSGVLAIPTMGLLRGDPPWEP